MTRISQQQLESYLWGAATLLRGTIDAGDYKQFIFPLLFYKRLCDVFDEETQAALKESGGDDAFAAYPENHRFQVPQDAHWREIRKAAKNVGQVLQSAMRAIETANPNKLYGIFGDAQWTNKDRLSDAMLRDLVEHFSSIDLTIANLPEDELGQGYEYLIKKFADDSGHTAAEFYTNRTVVHLMTELLDVQPAESVYDPTCGSGGMLLSCITHLRRQGKEWRNVRLYGQERNLMTSSIARMNCFLHGIEDFRIERGDTLSDPKFIQGDHLQRFDVVLANPPYSIKQWDREAFVSDPWGRNAHGTPPQSVADYAFWQHILASLAPQTGRCAILFPHGVLFRDAEDEMRRKLIETDLIECIVGLGMNLFYNSSMPSCVVICRTAKPKARRGKILLINAVNEVTRERAQSFLTSAQIRRILKAYNEFKSQDAFARVVTLDDVRQHSGNLNLPLYITTTSNGQAADTSNSAGLKTTLESWLRSAQAVRGATSSIIPTPNLARESNHITASDQCTRLPIFSRKGWRKSRLAEILEKTEETEKDPLRLGLERYLKVEHLDADSLRIRRWGDIADGTLPPTFHKVFRKGQILYPTRNPHLRRTAVADFDGICGEKTLTLTVRSGIEPNFLPFVFQSEAFITFATNRKIGSTNPHVRWRDIGTFEFLIPPPDQQRRIAEMLLAADAAAEAACTAAEIAQEALTAAVEHCTMGGGNNHRLQHTKFGAIPAHWQLTRIRHATEEIVERNTERILGRPDVLSISNKKGFSRSDERLPTTIDLARYKIVQRDDFGYNPMRLNIGSIARLTESQPGLVSPDYVVFRCNPKLLLPGYLDYFRTTRLWQRQICTSGQGSIRIRYYYDDIAEFSIPLPPVEEQAEILSKLQQQELTARQTETHRGNTRRLVQAFVDSLFRQ